MTPTFALTRRVVVRTFAVAAVVVPTTVLVSFFDRGFDAWPVGTVAMLLGPTCLGVGAAWAVAEWVADGSWSAATSLGWSPVRLLAGVAALGAVVGGLSLCGPGPDARTGIGTVAPIPAGAEHWWHDGSWGDPPPGWQQSPAALSTGRLVARLTTPAPSGAAWTVDRGELVRRAGWALGFLWAALLGAWCGVALSPGRARTDAALRAAASAFVGVAGWLVAVLAAAAYSSSMT